MVKQFANSMTLEHFICLVGLILLACWLVKTSLGRYALSDSVPRRNNMPFYMPLIALFIWFGSVSMVISVCREQVRQLPPWKNAFFDNLVLGLSSAMTTAVIIFLARASFVRRLKGFGLDAKTIHKDFLAAIVNLLSVWPIVLAMVILTLYFGQLIFGQDFQIQRHEQLEAITEYPVLPLQVLIVVVATIVAPVFEEMLFRGLFQTMIRSYLENSKFEIRNLKFPAYGWAWVSILISSALFATVHQRGHAPALFVLGVCLGYAYEKSGSLFRPIFIHAFFNAVTIAAVLY